MGEAARAMSIRELIAEITGKVALLARKEIELAKTEVKTDLQAQISTAKGLAVAALCVLLGINMLLVALVFALTAYMAGWLAALLVAAVLLVAGGLVGYVSWSRRVTRPLTLTRKTLRETGQWAKERLA
jgi:hypothetical protein